MTWPVKIRVYPENRALYVTAYVWPTKRAMRDHGRRENGMRGRYQAYCQTFQKIRIYEDGRERTSPQIGHVHFALARMGTEIVTHEFTHAALGWARRVGWVPADDDGPRTNHSGGGLDRNEERFCHALGQMVQQFVTRAYELGLYK